MKRNASIQAIRRNRRRFLHGMELLEDRRQLATTSTFVGSTLTFIGDAGIDVVSITSSATPGTVTYDMGGGPVIQAGVNTVVFDGYANNDQLLLLNPFGNTFAPAGGITFNGGDGADLLELTGGGIVATGTYNVTGVSSGNIAYSTAPALAINFNQVETVDDAFTATAITVNTSAAGENAIVEPGPIVGGFNTTTVRSNQMSTVRLGSKSTLQLNTLGGVDTVLLDGSAVGKPLESLTVAVSVDGGGNGDSVTILDTADLVGSNPQVTGASVSGLMATPIGFTNFATVTIAAGQGNDSIQVGVIATPTLTTLKVLGGPGFDTFQGIIPGGLVPSLSTSLLLSGDSDSVAPATISIVKNPAGGPGDIFFLNISSFVAQAEIIDTVTGQVISMSDVFSPAGHKPLYFNSMELLIAQDVVEGVPNTPIPAVYGDLYVRGNGTNESYVFYRGIGALDVRAKRNGVLANPAGFRPTGNIVTYAGAGNDSVEMNWTISGQSPARFFGQDGNDTMWGAGLNDLLVGGQGSDMLISSDGDDTLWGDDLPVAVIGAGGSFVQRQTSPFPSAGLPGADFLYGGNGNDFLFGEEGNDRIYGEGGDDYSHGGDGNDTLADTLGTNILRGEAGADRISGGSGSDIILGGDGNDVITGFGGRDLMIGGLGLDNVQDTQDNADDVLIGDSSPLEGDFPILPVPSPNYAVLSGNDVLLNGIMANWNLNIPFLARVATLQGSGIKATVVDGSRDVLRGNQLNNNYFQNLSSTELVRTFTAADFVDLT